MKIAMIEARTYEAMMSKFEQFTRRVDVFPGLPDCPRLLAV